MRKFLRIISLLIFLIFLNFFGFPENWRNFPVSSKIYKAKATNYLTNPSFTGNADGWTLSGSAYDSSRYQDSAGSVKTQALGKNNSATGAASQTISTNINSADTVHLSFYWSKQCVTIACAKNILSVDIAKPSAPSSWITIWSDSSIPDIGSATSWTGPSNLDVSSYFDESGEYKIRMFSDLRNGSNQSAQSLAWFDNVDINVVPPIISISISDGNISYGIVAPNSTKDTTATGLNDSQIVTNNGNIPENINIKGTNSNNWALASTAGAETYTHKFCLTNCDLSPVWTPLSTDYQALTTGLNVSGTQNFDLQIGTPTSTIHDTQQSVDVTIQAVAE